MWQPPCHILFPHTLCGGYIIWRYTSLRDRGTVNGTQTGIPGTILYILIQKKKKKKKKITYLPVSAVIPPPGG